MYEVYLATFYIYIEVREYVTWLFTYMVNNATQVVDVKITLWRHLDLIRYVFTSFITQVGNDWHSWTDKNMCTYASFAPISTG